MRAMLSLHSNLNHELNIALNREINAILKPELKARMSALKVINMKDVMPCNQAHAKQVDESLLTNLAEHQMHTKGAQKCCQCAYNSGYKQGSLLQHFISLDIESLGEGHANKDGHYKSIHQAFALGYSDGVNAFINS